MNIFLLCFLIALLPGVYFAGKKYFLIIPSQKYDSFLMRAFFLVPSMFAFVSVLSLFIYLLGFFPIGRDIAAYSVTYLGSNVVLLCPVFSDLLLICLVKKYILRDDIPPSFRKDFPNHAFYLFSPHRTIPYARAYFTKYDLLPPDKNGMRLKRQKEDLIMDFRRLDRADMSFTTDGEIIVNENAIDVLHRYGLTGFDLRPVKPFKGKSSAKNHQYFQLVCRHTMPEMSPKTAIVPKRSPAVCIPDNMIYYSADVSDEICDFNLTFEIFGTDRLIQDLNNTNRRMWIVSKKTMLLLMKHFDQETRFFVPVRFTEDVAKGTISEKEVNENA